MKLIHIRVRFDKHGGGWAACTCKPTHNGLMAIHDWRCPWYEMLKWMHFR